MIGAERTHMLNNAEFVNGNRKTALQAHSHSFTKSGMWKQQNLE